MYYLELRYPNVELYTWTQDCPIMIKIIIILFHQEAYETEQ